MVQKGSGESRTYHVVLIGMPPIRRALGRLLHAVLPPTEDTTSQLVIRVDGLHQRVDGREQAGQERTTAGRPHGGDEALVSPNGEDRRKEVLQHLLTLAKRNRSGKGPENLRPCTAHAGCSCNARSLSYRRGYTMRKAPSSSSASTGSRSAGPPQ